MDMIKNNRHSNNSVGCFDTLFQQYAQPYEYSEISGSNNISANPNELNSIVEQNKVRSENIIINSSNKSDCEVIRIGSTPTSSLAVLVKASEEYRQAAQTWNKKLAEHVTDKDILAKYSAQVTEPSIFEYLLTK